MPAYVRLPDRNGLESRQTLAIYSYMYGPKREQPCPMWLFFTGCLFVKRRRHGNNTYFRCYENCSSGRRLTVARLWCGICAGNDGNLPRARRGGTRRHFGKIPERPATNASKQVSSTRMGEITKNAMACSHHQFGGGSAFIDKTPPRCPST